MLLANHTENQPTYGQHLFGCPMAALDPADVTLATVFLATQKANSSTEWLFIGGENDRRVCGPHIKKQLWSIPERLTSELMYAAMAGENSDTDTETTHTTDRTVKYALDLFSGGESWKALAEQIGYVYTTVLG